MVNRLHFFLGCDEAQSLDIHLMVARKEKEGERSQEQSTFKATNSVTYFL
jgi:hypothetical protein